jgi:hypothetical protein
MIIKIKLKGDWQVIMTDNKHKDYTPYRRTVSRGKSLVDNDLFIDFDDTLTEENIWKESVELAEDALDIKSLIKKVPNVKPKQTPPTVTLNNYEDSVKVKCVKCGTICIDDINLVDVPMELSAHDTAFGWYCDKCHTAQSDYEWDIESFRDLCDAQGFGFKAHFGDPEYMDDVELDDLASMINSWNRAKKDPKCEYSSNPQEVREMEQDFITGAKKFGLDIDSNVFNK